MSLTYTTCTAEHLDTVLKIAKKTYWDTFSPHNPADVMRGYMQSAFTPAGLLAELQNPASTFLLAYDGDALAGYIKVNDAPAQTELHDASSLELERIYLLEEHQGKGFGKALLEKAVAIAEQRGCKFLWLGVWEHNRKALAFYERCGFVRFGEHPFLMGGDVQTDYLLRLDLSR